MAQIQLVHRPSWLSRESFDRLLEQYRPLPACVRCGTTEDLTVDHIVPRWAGGTDAVSNLQILCRSDNATKGVREDAYWKQSFYWDFSPDEAGFSRMRQAHRELFNEIVHFRNEYFSRNISDIARHLYVNAWVVGSGKTLGIPVAAWAFNQVIREKWGTAARRVDRILVVTKDQAIRDQIAHDLPFDLVKYKIVPSPPRVGVIREGSQFKQQAWLDAHDIIVTCEQQLWEHSGGPRADLAKILAHFPLIGFDEPHYANDQIAKIVDAADSSVCLGFTGTPINGCGELLKRMVLLSVYDYQEASDTDRSLKYLDFDIDHMKSFVRVLKLDEGAILERGLPVVTKDAQQPGYSIQVECAKAVVDACLEEALTLDKMIAEREPCAPHRRNQPDVEVSLQYPVHVLVVFDNIATAENLAAYYNHHLNTVRYDYPENQGWRVEVVHAGSNGRSGHQLAPKPLARQPGDKPHPWVYSYKSGGKLDKYCARILFVVDMAREGVNNPYCGIVGVACSSGSIVAAVQRDIGRQLRAFTARSGRKLRVPPEKLDSVRIITHETFKESLQAIVCGIDFVCNMRSHLDGLRYIEDLNDEIPYAPVKEIERDLSVQLRDKLEIVSSITDCRQKGETPDIDALIRAMAPAGGRRAEGLKEWVEMYQRAPAEARRGLRLDSGLTPIFILTHEELKHTPTDADLEHYVRVHAPELAGRLPVNDGNRDWILLAHRQHANRFQQRPLTSDSHINTLCRTLVAGPAFTALGNRFKGPPQKVFELATAAVKIKLGVPRGIKLKDDSDWDIPQAHAIIRRPDIQLELTGWVVGSLIDKGYCPSLAGLRNLGADLRCPVSRTGQRTEGTWRRA